MTRKTLALGFATLAVVAIAIVAFLRWPQSAWVLQLTQGQRLSYSLDYQSEGKGQVDFGTDFLQGSDRPKMESGQAAFKGVFDLEVLEVLDQSLKAKFAFAPETFVLSLGHQSLPTPSAPIMGTIELSRDGTIRDIAFQADQHRDYGQIVLDIFTLLELNLPRDSKSEWKGEEISATRNVPVLWQRHSKTDQGLQLSKSYKDANVSGEGRYTLDSKSHIWQSVQAERSRRFFLRGRLISEDRTKLSLALNPHTKPMVALGTDLVRETLKAETLRKGMQERTYRDELGSTSEAEIHAGLDSFKVGTSMEPYRKLKAYLFLFPAKTQGFRQALISYPREDSRFGLLTMALTAVGDTEAQKLLRDAIEASEGAKKHELIPHLAFVDQPDQQSEQYLKELANTAPEAMIRDTAELGLGIMAHQVRDQTPERARKILMQLHDKLLTAVDTKTKIHALSAIGNIGLPEQLDSTLPYTKDADPKIRAAAFQSLRFVPSPEVAGLLATAVQHDPESRVREEASEALTYVPQAEDDLARYETILFAETNISVLKNVLRVLANTGSPAAKALMQKFLDSCGRTEVCGYAESLIQGLQ